MAEQNQLQNMFFSKDIITNLHKIVQQQTNTSSASKEDKQEIVNILVKNMKTVYKSLDLSKINTHYMHRRRLRKEKMVLRYGEVIFLCARDFDYN